MKFKKLVGVLAFSALVIPGLSLASDVSAWLTGNTLVYSSQKILAPGDVLMLGEGDAPRAGGGGSPTLSYVRIVPSEAAFFDDGDGENPLTLTDSKNRPVYVVKNAGGRVIGLASQAGSLPMVSFPVSASNWSDFAGGTGAFSSAAMSSRLEVVAPTGTKVSYSRFVSDTAAYKQWESGYTVRVPIVGSGALDKSTQSKEALRVGALSPDSV